MTYHSIDDSGALLSTPPILFERQMKFLKEKKYRVISLRKLIEHIGSHRKPLPKSVVLTFDDGYKNNYEVAFPVLKSSDFTATFFVVTQYVGKRSTWATDETSLEAPLMSWEEIKEMATYGMEIQPHSCTHPHLPQLTRDEMIKEILGSKRHIEEVVMQEASIFCYPFGEFNSTCISVLSELGFKAAVSIQFGRNNSIENVYALQRVGSAHFQDMTAFKVCLYGFYDWHLIFKNRLLQKASDASLKNRY